LNGLFAVQASVPPWSPQSIFVLRNNGIGDLLVIAPLFDALKRNTQKQGSSSDRSVESPDKITARVREGLNQYREKEG
jgi:hypothetical protein